MQHEITTESALLTQRGELHKKGWGRDLLLEYHRSDVKANALRIKEWDYYCVLAEDEGVSFTISDLGYIGFIAATVFDFKRGEEVSNSITTPFPLGKLNLPESSKKGDVIFKNNALELKFTLENGQRVLEVDWQNFTEGKNLVGRIDLVQNANDDSMMIATPFPGKPRAFYYNHKVNCMPATGELTLGDRKLKFTPENAQGVLDWGRGVWTYANTWYWGSASGTIANKRFGFNIGYGFGDTSAASENMIIYEGVAHKLDQVNFHIPEDSFMKPWRFSSSDGRLELDFVPLLDRYSNTNMLLIQSWQHQVFGHFSGEVILDDGQKIVLKDFLGFAEKVKNRW